MNQNRGAYAKEGAKVSAGGGTEMGVVFDVEKNRRYPHSSYINGTVITADGGLDGILTIW
ncbi:hypothetical protein [Paenibacillus sp. H1-7]|uniref:hypothetical protein n=1 Tax=Paenibacillus sp. H1-7 TaxID=2282849 RepID=UPI001EF79785|nr:hypothetical protein [Paenibacillus sp. H1-7]